MHAFTVKLRSVGLQRLHSRARAPVSCATGLAGRSAGAPGNGHVNRQPCQPAAARVGALSGPIRLSLSQHGRGRRSMKTCMKGREASPDKQ
ncbi:hypothetical protein PAHAL_6G232300 [Panicum hallii]|uniref:Uncharacterized protein n=1 Tax=Panicum hallii TaxID=206008 RepID=A0A2T8IH90_9POAL|nr:hypothetical protein PAHAL_6G232300 [Panicum hallii]